MNFRIKHFVRLRGQSTYLPYIEQVVIFSDIYACLPGADDVGETSQGSVPVLFGIRVAWSNFGRTVSAASELASLCLRSAALIREAPCGRGLRQSRY